MAYLDGWERKKEKKKTQKDTMTEEEFKQGLRLIKEGKTTANEFLVFIYVKRIIQEKLKKE